MERPTETQCGPAATRGGKATQRPTGPLRAHCTAPCKNTRHPHRPLVHTYGHYEENPPSLPSAGPPLLSNSSAAHGSCGRKTAPCEEALLSQGHPPTSCGRPGVGNTTCLPWALTASSLARLSLTGAAAHPAATGGPSQQPPSPCGLPLTPLPARRAPSNLSLASWLLTPASLSPLRRTRPPSGHSPSRAWK